MVTTPTELATSLITTDGSTLVLIDGEWVIESTQPVLRTLREPAVAGSRQRHLLPHVLPDVHAVEVASRYLPMDAHGGGGDWFDVIPLPGARVALVMGDVVGHGADAAATKGRLRAATRALANLDLPPADVLTCLDDLVVRLAKEAARPDDFMSWIMGATCLYTVYDPNTRLCTLARAGHPLPAIIDSSGGVTFPDLPAGTPIGLGMACFESVEMELPEGSVIAAYTDGLIESREADIDVGLKRLSFALARTGITLDDLCSEVIDTMMMTTPSQDDVALLLARTRSLGFE